MRATTLVLSGLSLLAMLAGTPALAQKQQVYRWVDTDGITHYSDSPPPQGQGFETRDVAIPPAPPPPPAAAPAEQPVAAAPDPQRQQKCQTARNNLALLRGDKPLSMDVDGDGVTEDLDAVERQRQVDLANRQIRNLCGPG